MRDYFLENLEWNRCLIRVENFIANRGYKIPEKVSKLELDILEVLSNEIFADVEHIRDHLNLEDSEKIKYEMADALQNLETYKLIMRRNYKDYPYTNGLTSLGREYLIKQQAKQ